jgi:hypothetical protein
VLLEVRQTDVAVYERSSTMRTCGRRNKRNKEDWKNDKMVRAALCDSKACGCLIAIVTFKGP